ncbi:MAG: hypothetical protein AABZ47_02780 [Planctomycetota bacterium]
MKKVVYGLIVLLAVFHQDFWWWDDVDPLVLGFIPIGLAYHAGISILAGVFWGLASRYCWPVGVDIPESALLETGIPPGGHR